MTFLRCLKKLAMIRRKMNCHNSYEVAINVADYIIRKVIDKSDYGN